MVLDTPYSHRMDWSTVWVGVSTFVAGGVLGSIATVYGTRKESQDRRDALALEREKFEHERDKHLRERQRELLGSAKEALSDLHEFMYDAHNYHPERLEAFVGDVHEARVHYAAVLTAGRRLGDYGMVEEAALMEQVGEVFGKALRDFSEENYRGWGDSSRAADHALEARLARIP